MNLHAKNPTNLIFIAIKNANLFSKFKMLKLRRGIQRVKKVSLYKKGSPTSKTKESTFLVRSTPLKVREVPPPFSDSPSWLDPRTAVIHGGHPPGVRIRMDQ